MRVLVVGILFVLEGIRSTVTVVQRLPGSEGADGAFTLTLFGLTINLSIFLLPIGVGILMGKPLARTAARALCWIFYVVAGLVLAGGIAAALFGGEGVFIMILFYAAIFMAPVIAVHRILYSGRANAYFEPPEDEE